MAIETRRFSGTRGQILLPTEVLTKRSSKGGRLTGVTGFLKWKYFVAAEVRSYTAARDAQGRWSLTCIVAHANDYNLAQRPLHFVAPFDKGEWRWLVESIEIRDGQIRAALGPPM